MKMRSVVVAVFAAALFLMPSAASAQALPDFSLTSPEGAPVQSNVLNGAGQWILAYVVPGSGPSDRLVQSLGQSWTPERAGRVVFIVSGSVEKAKAYIADKGGEALAAGAVWYADPEGEAWSALKFQGTLAIAGMTGTNIQWKLDGVIAEPEVLQPTVTKWLDGISK